MIDKSKYNIVDVISKHVSLKKIGSEHYGICPFHNDSKESLQVNEKKQVFKCFACGTGGDNIEFLLKLGRNFEEACSEISGGNIDKNYKIEKLDSKPKVKSKNDWEFISVPPQEQIDITHYNHGKPSKTWVYHNAIGIKICYIARFDFPNNEKQVLPMVFATNGVKNEWRWMGIPDNRPLYNLHLIVSNPKASILLVEGEKTADAAQKELDIKKTVVTTWIGGANGIKKTDFSTLNNRKVIFWADNDNPGFNAMNSISDLINSDVKKFVHIPKDLPNKWDAADKQWKPNELRDFVKDNLSNNKYPILIATSDPLKSIPNPPLPPVPKKPKNKISQNEHFKILGYDKDENSKLVYYFFSFDAKCVVKLSPTSMNKSNLMMLAPLNYWEDKFPGSRVGVNTDMAQQFLIGQSHKVGQFKDKLIRGRGIWKDDNSFIVHTGTSLISDNNEYDLKEFESKYVYEIGESLSYGIGEGLSTFESAKLIDKMKWLLWERNINAYLLAGWCVIAPFCGALNWRPHIWITGPSGSGKSWVMSTLLRKVLGDIPVVVQGKTTEAGVRGLLQSDARPLLFDESDVDDENDKIRIQSILSLARSSSGNDTGVVGKGTQTGGSRSYEMRSCFAFSSIGVALNQRADHTRFTVLSLKAFENERTKEDFAKYEIALNDLLDDDYSKNLQARTLSIFDVILDNSKTFANAASHLIGNRRVGDQIGSMLAGAYSLTSKNKITYEKAIEWLKDKDLTEEKSLSQTKDELQLLSIILGFTLKVEGEFRTLERNIGELILVESNFIYEEFITDETARKTLRRIGIMIVDGYIVFSNTSPLIKKIISQTSWSNSHANILARIDGAVKFDSRTFYPGLNSRGVGIPLDLISNGYKFEKPNINPIPSNVEDDIFNNKGELY